MTKRFLVSILAAAVLIAWSPALSAHPGHGHKVLGTVSGVNGNHVEVKDVDGKVTKHLLDAKTKVKRGKLVVKASDLKVGDRVVVVVTESKDTAGKAVTTVTEVQIGAAAAAKPVTQK
ncbi:MAG TPA: hypothetical protein VNJ02_19385 [Vicinamibacterales bacterium]|nr:hypothetical protein [Vicinamibacterales bacterium]